MPDVDFGGQFEDVEKDTGTAYLATDPVAFAALLQDVKLHRWQQVVLKRLAVPGVTSLAVHRRQRCAEDVEEPKSTTVKRIESAVEQATQPSKRLERLIAENPKYLNWEGS